MFVLVFLIPILMLRISKMSDISTIADLPKNLTFHKRYGIIYEELLVGRSAIWYKILYSFKRILFCAILLLIKQSSLQISLLQLTNILFSMFICSRRWHQIAQVDFQIQLNEGLIIIMMPLLSFFAILEGENSEHKNGVGVVLIFLISVMITFNGYFVLKSGVWQLYLFSLKTYRFCKFKSGKMIEWVTQLLNGNSRKKSKKRVSAAN